MTITAVNASQFVVVKQALNDPNTSPADRQRQFAITLKTAGDPGQAQNAIDAQKFLEEMTVEKFKLYGLKYNPMNIAPDGEAEPIDDIMQNCKDPERFMGSTFKKSMASIENLRDGQTLEDNPELKTVVKERNTHCMKETVTAENLAQIKKNVNTCFSKLIEGTLGEENKLEPNAEIPYAKSIKDGWLKSADNAITARNVATA